MLKKDLELYLAQKKSLREIAYLTDKPLGSVRYWMKKHELVPVYIKHRVWDVDKLREVAKTARTRREILVALGMRDSGSIYTVLASVAAQNFIELPEGTTRHNVPKLAPEQVLVLGASAGGQRLRRLMIEFLGVEYKCSSCELTDWLGKVITLEVDHINGNHRDNRPENLRFLCPNCHSQTDTYSKKKCLPSSAEEHWLPKP